MDDNGKLDKNLTFFFSAREAFCFAAALDNDWEGYRKSKI